MQTKTILTSTIAAVSTFSGVAQNINEQSIDIRSGQSSISYLEKGSGNTTLLFLHGWCINKSYWTEQLEYFSKNYRVIAMDHAGFGKSTANRDNWSIEEYAQDVLAFIDELKLENVVLVAHSMSGEIMLEAVLQKHPSIMGIVGIDNFKFIDFQFTPEQYQQMASFFPMLLNDFQNNAPRYAENMLFHSTTETEIKERVKNDFSNADPKVGYDSFMNLMHFSQSTPSKLEALPFKLHLVSCDATPIFVEGLKKRCRQGYSIHEIKGSGHYPMLEKPDELNQILTKVLEEIKLELKGT